MGEIWEVVPDVEVVLHGVRSGGVWGRSRRWCLHGAGVET